MTGTTAAGALADTSKLTPFEGKSVRQVGIEIPSAAGGLRESMKIEPQEFHQGETVYVVLECPVVKVRFDPIDSDDPAGDQRRVHVFGTAGAAIVDRELVGEALAEMRRRVDLANEAAQGIGRLPVDDEAAKAHADGLHASGLVPGCPDCEAEAAAVAAETAEAESRGEPPAPTPIGSRQRKARAAKGQ